MTLMLHHAAQVAINLLGHVWRVFIQNWTDIIALISLRVLPIF